MMTQREKEICDAIDFLTSCTSKEEISKVVEMVQSQHRTHQQSLGRLIYALLQAWSRQFEVNNYDLRNKETAKFANDAIKATGEQYFPFI